MAEKTDEKITMTKGELEEMLSKRDADAKMSPEEKQIRAIVRDESESTIRKVLTEFFDFADGESGGQNDGGGTAETLWTKFVKAAVS